MASRALDLLNTSVRAPSHFTAGATTNNTAGSSADMINADNPVTVQVNLLASTNVNISNQIKVQESTDGTTWSDITGASFAAITAGTSTITAMTCNRSLQYMRTYNTQASSVAPTLLTQFIAPLKQSP